MELLIHFPCVTLANLEKFGNLAMPFLSVLMRDDPAVSAVFAFASGSAYYFKTPPAPGGAVLFLLGLCVAIIVIWVLMTWKK